MIQRYRQLLPYTLFIIHTVILPCFSQKMDSTGIVSHPSIDTFQTENTITDTMTHDLSKIKDTTSSLKKPVPGVMNDSLINKQHVGDDSLKIANGSYFGAGIGWSVGSFDIVSLWKSSLFDSLSHFNLDVDSYISDTTAESFGYIDTADIKYVIKEQPGQYNVTFPVSLLLNKINQHNKYCLSLSFAYLGKTLKSVITGAIDTLSESVNIKQHFRTYTLSLVGSYALLIPQHYFKINGVEKSFLTIGIGLTPQIFQQTINAVYDGKNERLQSIRRVVDDSRSNKTVIGTGITLRTGISTLRHFSNRSIIEFNLCYSLTRFDYFYSEKSRLLKGWFNPNVKNSEKPLSYLSNRLDLSISLLRHRPEALK